MKGFGSKLTQLLKRLSVYGFTTQTGNGDVRCLCPKCLSDYIHDPNYIVRRLDPFAKSKDHCDKCNNSGWDYIVYDKRTSVKGKGCRNVK